MRIQSRHFRGKLKNIKNKLPASTSGRVLIACITALVAIFLFNYLSGIIFLVATIVLGAFIYSNTESHDHDTDYSSTVFDDEDEPRGDGYRDGPEGYGYYSGGVRDDD
ncbi:MULTISPECIES: DUF3742 family protein [unclassified Pantoea]|uniref:DUF3742 family protein n=1 Tax=unclassified Pantoea TaxID=2630326 RepID=UPI001CD44720|nr:MULTISPECIES: DUF3742 family protein [unclassified Pantoea]MCA1178362.1 DUF3742 family protein [Pantoea sp. alder69]MCA1253165.1 DUF3742 family protein [Pantoea sp. alder70]MCA1266542.1 DUF3742 family protein [Pantoea sp. alder81]